MDARAKRSTGARRPKLSIRRCGDRLSLPMFVRPSSRAGHGSACTKRSSGSQGDLKPGRPIAAVQHRKLPLRGRIFLRTADGVRVVLVMKPMKLLATLLLAACTGVRSNPMPDAQLPVGNRVFMTSQLYVGGLIGGLDGADAKCNERALAANLPG